MIIIKSYTSGRVRLKSKYFDKNILNSISKDFDQNFMKTRVNDKCKSIIIHFNEKKIDKDTILQKAYTFIPNISNSKSDQNLSKRVCHSSSCQSCKPKKNLKKSALVFGGLSICAAAIFTGVTLPASLTLGITIFASIPLLKDAYNDIKKKRFTLQTFLSLSLIGATFLGEIETAFEVIYILRGGMLLEEFAANRSKAKIHELLQTDIKKAYILVNDVEVECDLKDVKKGDIVVVRSGEKIPVDGTITYGKAQISEALINGRSEPSFKQIGDKVYSNTLLERGRIFINVDAIGSGTYLSKIISQVEFALANRSESEKAADKLAARLLTLGTFLTGATLLITGSLIRAFSVMIVMSCPCSTILAASTAISAGIAKGAKDGILIKGGEYLEKFSQSDVICFDKTGTLTTGKPQITHITLNDNVSEKELFKVASLAEYRNIHPIALSILNHAKTLKIDTKITKESELLAGLGAKIKHEGDTILVGNSTLFKRYKISLTKYKKQEESLTKNGKTVVYVSKNREVLGFIAFEHEARIGASEIVKNLKTRGVKEVILLTGDDEKVANAFSSEYGFDRVYANILPEQKAEIIKDLKQKHKIVSMIGDGINDTIAMSQADIGISFASGGSEAAVEISDIAIINSDIDDVLKLYDISKYALEVVNQNYWIGTSTNLLGVVLAALGLLSPVAAGGIHVAHTIGIMANASRIALKDN